MAENRRAQGVARRFCEERQVYNWVEDHNVTRGLAPRSSLVSEQFDEVRQVQLADGGPDVTPRANLVLGKNRTFLCRWRKRHGIKFGNIPPSGHMDIAEARSKVLLSFLFLS